MFGSYLTGNTSLLYIIKTIQFVGIIGFDSENRTKQSVGKIKNVLNIKASTVQNIITLYLRLDW
jgi:hypothetical protein